MPSGCEFTCKNEKCKCYNTGFVITSPWPMGNIQLVINSSSVKDNAEFREQLINVKKEGKKLACIPFPNIDKIPTECYRVQLWSKEANLIWEYHIKSDNVETIYDDPEVPKLCPKTHCNLVIFTEAITEGINCPHCGEKLSQSRWWTNET